MAFRNYNAAAEESLRDALDQNAQELQLFERTLRLFPEAIFVGEVCQPPDALLLANNSHSLLLAAGRIGLTGHANAMFPILRAALESASYCFLIVKNPALSEVWRDRHSSPSHKKACRRAFNSAVQAVADYSKWTPEAKALITDTYESMIDHGAHPNPRSIFMSTVVEDAGDYWHLRSNTLYEADASMTKWTTIVCAKTSLLVASVLAECLKSDDKSVWDYIDRLTVEIIAYISKSAAPKFPQ